MPSRTVSGDDICRGLQESVSVNGTNYGLNRVEFDGHLWVTYKLGGQPGGVVHHPDCPCLAKAKENQ